MLTNVTYYTSQTGPAAQVAAMASANPLVVQSNFIIGIIVSYLLPWGLLSMAWLAVLRSPRLASLACVLVIIGAFPLWFFSAQDYLSWDIAQHGSNPAEISLAVRFGGTWIVSYFNAAFVLGTIIAPVIIGIALWKGRIVPAWSALTIILSRLTIYVFPLIPNLPAIFVQLPSFVLLFIGSIPAGLLVLKKGFS